jgi:hypothetical protein
MQRERSTRIQRRLADLALLCLTLSIVAGCGPRVRSARFGEQPAPREGGPPTQVFSTKLPECPYEELGLVRVEKGHGLTSMQAMLDAMRDRARRMGGDAVVGVGHISAVEGSVAAGSVTTAGGLAGTVIRYTDSACMRE